MTPSEIGKAMRAIPSAKRDAAVKQNLASGRDRYNSQRVLGACTCRVVRSDGTHESGCRVYMREKQRTSRANKKG